MISGEKITFESFKDALVTRIVDMCINMNLKILPDTFKYLIVKSWTKIITEDVYPKDKGTPYKIQKANEYYVLQCPNSGQGGTEMVYTTYTTQDVKNIINQVLIANKVDYIVKNIMYVALFAHVLKILEKFISENFIIYVSPFYNSQLIVLAPTGNYNYELPIDMQYSGNNAYSAQLITNYLTNFSKTVLYSIPANNIKILSYGTTYAKGVPIPVPKKNFILTYNYTPTSEDELRFTVSVSFQNEENPDNVSYLLYYKLTANSRWNVYDPKKLKTKVNRTFYFYVVPTNNYAKINYNELGKDNKTGYKISKTTINVNPHPVLTTYTYGPCKNYAEYEKQLVVASIEHPNGWESDLYRNYRLFLMFKWSVYETVYDTQKTWIGLLI